MSAVTQILFARGTGKSTAQEAPKPKAKWADIDGNKRGMDEAAAKFADFKGEFQIDKALATEVELSPGALLSLADVRNLAGTKGAVQAADLGQRRRVILDFISTVVLSIEWYVDAMQHDRSWLYRNLLIGASFLLILLMPLALFYGQWLVTSNVGKAMNPDAAAWTTGLAALLTGLLGFQKALANWLDTHRRYGAWWKAKSSLKDILFTIELKWCGRTLMLDASNNPTKQFDAAFIAALEEAAAQARVVIRAEEQSFFDTLSAPTPDVLTTITGAQTPVRSLLTAFASQPPAPSEKEIAAKKAALERDAAEKSAALLQAQVDQLQAAFDALPAAPANGTPEKAMKDSLQGRLVSVKTDLALARGTLIASAAANA